MTKVYKRMTTEEIMAQVAEDIAYSKKVYDALIQHDMLDDDGYPTNSAIHIIESWHYSDPKGWFAFIKSIWHLSSWGWSEGELPRESKTDILTYQYHISTAGWSGNETLIRAMEKNHMLWDLNWEQSRRGGHYIFELDDVYE